MLLPSWKRNVPKLFERRSTSAGSVLGVIGRTTAALVMAMLLAAFLFVSYGLHPLEAYFALFHEPFGTLRGFGYTLVRASPLLFVALGTIVSWRSGFGYLGFEGCFAIGAISTAWLALSADSGGRTGPLRLVLFIILTTLSGFASGGAWAALTGLVRARWGGNEVLISLMSNYVAILFLQYMVSGPLRAPGSLPETRLLPRNTWLPFILPGTRAHAGILIAFVAAGLVWLLLRKMSLGYELIATGFNPSAARYAGINVPSRLILAAFLAGGLGAFAGMVEVLGSQHRLMDGISGGIGFLGIIVALLARLDPLAVIPAAILYAGMSVGADAMQRRANVPSSITAILESLIVLLVLASDLLRHYEIHASALWRRAPETVRARQSE